MLILAVKCHHKLLALGTGGETVVFNFQSEERELYNTYIRCPNGKGLLEKYLDEFFGLTALYKYFCQLKVSVKK
jgi:hypothetical protein